MKLAFVINVFREDDFHSGGEKLFYELVNKTVKDGFVVDLYCTTYLGKENILRNNLHRVIQFGHPKDFKSPKKIEAFYDKVKTLAEKEEYKYDYIISENFSPPLGIGILQGHSLIHYHEQAGNAFSKLLFKLKKHKHIEAQKKWMKQPYKKIVVPSKVLKNELMKNFSIPEENFTILQPGVDLPQPQVEIKEPEKPFVFGVSAPSFEKKGGYVFLKALKLLKAKKYDFKAKIIYPKHKKNLKLQLLLTLYNLRDRVEFLPYQEDMKDFYESVNCIVVPSLLETFALVTTEAMSYKKPVIISSFCGASEIIVEGRNGFVFDKNNSSDLAEKMEKFLNGNIVYDLLAECAYETAVKLSWQSFYEKFRTLFVPKY